MYTTSQVLSQTYRRGDVATAVMFPVGGRFLPVSISVRLPPVDDPQPFHVLHLALPAFFYTQHNLANLAQELRRVWRKFLLPLMSPRASSLILSEIFLLGLVSSCWSTLTHQRSVVMITGSFSVLCVVQRASTQAWCWFSTTW